MYFFGIFSTVVGLDNVVVITTRPTISDKFLFQNFPERLLGKSIDRIKRKGTAGKVEPSKKYLEEDKFTLFQSWHWSITYL